MKAVSGGENRFRDKIIVVGIAALLYILVVSRVSGGSRASMAQSTHAVHLTLCLCASLSCVLGFSIVPCPSYDVQVRQPFKPGEPGGVHAAAVRAHGGAGGLL